MAPWRDPRALPYVQAVLHTPLPRFAASLLVALALGPAVPSALAQGAEGADATAAVTHPKPRSLVLGVAGAIIGGLAGFAFGKGGQSSGAQMTAIGAAAGGLTGFFIGRQMDERRAVTFHGAPSLRIPNIAIELEGEPAVLAVRDSQAIVGGSTGVQLFSAMDPRLMPLGTRAAGLHGIGAIDLSPGTGWLALGSRTGLYIYPPSRGPGVLVRRANISAIAAADTRLFVATESRIETVPVNADSARTWPSTTLGAPVRDVVVDEARAVLWASTDRELVALRITGDSLVAIGAVPLPGIGLRLVIERGLAAVAMGEKGVALIDISDPLHPKSRGQWTMAHFAYDVSLDGTRLFVAAGPEGVYLVDVDGPVPRTIGLARSLGFASAVVSSDGHTFILDRRTNALRRIISTY